MFDLRFCAFYSIWRYRNNRRHTYDVSVVSTVVQNRLKKNKKEEKTRKTNTFVSLFRGQAAVDGGGDWRAHAELRKSLKYDRFRTRKLVSGRVICRPSLQSSRENRLDAIVRHSDSTTALLWSPSREQVYNRPDVYHPVGGLVYISGFRLAIRLARPGSPRRLLTNK